MGIFFCFLYRNIADQIERNWSVADESSYVSDSQFPSDIQVVASNTTVPTTTIQNDAGRSDNMEYSGDVSSIEHTHHDPLRSGLINSVECSENA